MKTWLIMVPALSIPMYDTLHGSFRSGFEILRGEGNERTGIWRSRSWTMMGRLNELDSL